MMDGSAFDGVWTTALPKDRSANIIVMEGVLEYFTKEQTATCLHVLCDSCGAKGATSPSCAMPAWT